MTTKMKAFNFLAIPFLLITLIFSIATRNGAFNVTSEKVSLPKTGIIMSKFTLEGPESDLLAQRFMLAIKNENNVIDMFNVEQNVYNTYKEKARVTYTSSYIDGKNKLKSIELLK